MTTNENLLPGTLIEYKTVGGTPATAWLKYHVAGLTDKSIGLRVVGEADEYNKNCNHGLEFTLYVKPRGRAKVLELPKIDPTEQFVPPADVANDTGNAVRAERRAARENTAPRVAGSHADCTHPKSKAGRAACRKARATA